MGPHRAAESCSGPSSLAGTRASSAGAALLLAVALTGISSFALGRGDPVFNTWHRTLAQDAGSTCEEYYVRSYVGYPDEDTCQTHCGDATKTVCLAFAFDAPSGVCFMKVPCGSTGPDELKFPTLEEMLAPVDMEDNLLSVPSDKKSEPPSELEDAWADFWANFGNMSAEPLKPAQPVPPPPAPVDPITSDIQITPEETDPGVSSSATLTPGPETTIQLPPEITDSVVAFEIVGEVNNTAKENQATQAIAPETELTPSMGGNATPNVTATAPPALESAAANLTVADPGTEPSASVNNSTVGDDHSVPPASVNNSTIGDDHSVLPAEVPLNLTEMSPFAPPELTNGLPVMQPVWTDALPGVSPSRAEMFTWTMLNRTYCHGEPLTEDLLGETLESCKEACGQLLSCGGWAYRGGKSKICRLRPTCAKIRPGLPAWTSGYKEIVEPEAVPVPYHYNISEATACNDPVVAKVALAGSSQGCQDKCSESEFCQAFSYESQSFTCRLTAACLWASDAPGWTSGVKTLGGELFQPSDGAEELTKPALVGFGPFDLSVGKEELPDLVNFDPLGQSAETPSPDVSVWGDVEDYDIACTLNSAPLSYQCHADCAVNCASLGLNGLLIPHMLENELQLCHSTHSKGIYQGSMCCCGEDLSQAPPDEERVIPCPGDLEPWAACDAWCRIHAAELGPGTAADCVPGQAWCFPYGLLGGSTGNCHSIECSPWECCCNARV